MYKIVDGIYVGTVDDLPCAYRNDMAILGACKDPLHRHRARMRGAYADGYILKSMPQDEPEYLYAKRRHALYCNLIDAPDVKYIFPKIIDRALKFIDDEREIGYDVLIVCNHAESRSPSIALMWLIKNDMITKRENETIIKIFKRQYYPKYNPGIGFAEYVMRFWRRSNNG